MDHRNQSLKAIMDLLPLNSSQSRLMAHQRQFHCPISRLTITAARQVDPQAILIQSFTRLVTLQLDNHLVIHLVTLQVILRDIHLVTLRDIHLVTLQAQTLLQPEFQQHQSVTALMAFHKPQNPLTSLRNCPKIPTDRLQVAQARLAIINHQTADTTSSFRQSKASDRNSNCQKSMAAVNLTTQSDSSHRHLASLPATMKLCKRTQSTRVTQPK